MTSFDWYDIGLLVKRIISSRYVRDFYECYLLFFQIGNKVEELDQENEESTNLYLNSVILNYKISIQQSFEGIFHCSSFIILRINIYGYVKLLIISNSSTIG